MVGNEEGGHVGGLRREKGVTVGESEKMSCTGNTAGFPGSNEGHEVCDHKFKVRPDNCLSTKAEKDR